jgi:hypothetical protein
MKTPFWTALAAGVCLLVAAPSIKASEWNQKTIFTFNQPVEVPGHVLPAGTYMFKLANNQSDRNIVEVYGKNGKHLYGTFLAVPDYRLRTPGKPIITFTERAAGAPEAVKAWFYPGDNFGHEFVYPKTKAMQLAKANNEPVASMSDEEFNGSNMQQGHIHAVKPTGEEVTVIEVFGSAPQTTSSTSNGQSGRTYGNQARNH